MSACGSSASSSNISQSTPSTQVSSESVGTRTISTSTGDVEVPENPQRVVVQYVMGDVFALGVTPVATSDVYVGAAFEELANSIDGLEQFSELNEEAIMALDPDLILVINEDDVAKFSKIAPTILIPYGTMTQEERVTFVGEILNKQEEAKEVLQEYDTVLETSKKALADAGFDAYTVSVFEGGKDATMSISGDSYGAGNTVYQSLALKAPEAVQQNLINKNVAKESVSFEVLSQYAGDFIIRNSYDGMADLSEDPIWNSIPAVQNNRVINIPFGLNYYTDIYSAITQVQTISDSLLESLEQTK